MPDATLLLFLWLLDDRRWLVEIVQLILSRLPIGFTSRVLGFICNVQCIKLNGTSVCPRFLVVSNYRDIYCYLYRDFQLHLQKRSLKANEGQGFCSIHYL